MKPLEQRLQELEAEHIRLIDQVVEMANALEETIAKNQRHEKYIMSMLLALKAD